MVREMRPTTELLRVIGRYLSMAEELWNKADVVPKEQAYLKRLESLSWAIIGARLMAEEKLRQGKDFKECILAAAKSLEDMVKDLSLNGKTRSPSGEFWMLESKTEIGG